MIYSDIELARKIERTEGCANAAFVKTRARLDPESHATWIDVAGVYAMFDGVHSPCTQTFGLGLFGEVTGQEMQNLEDFFIKRGAPVFHEVSPLADSSLMPMLNERGYSPMELTSVMYREIDAANTRSSDVSTGISTRIIGQGDVDLWAKTSASGWATEHESLADFMFRFGQISAQTEGSYAYLAERDGDAIATGMLLIYDGVCVLAGASTIPEKRNKGAQNALLTTRLKFAVANGCTLAIMGAFPGSQSQRNAQKNGFSIAYTRIKWRLDR